MLFENDQQRKLELKRLRKQAILERDLMRLK